MDPKLTTTVLVPTFNRERYLPECIESLLEQTFPPVQIIVINDGSTDGTSEVVGRYAKDIEYIEQGNSGKSAALNRGLSRSSGDLIWVLDDDDIAFPDAIERFTRCMEAHQGVGLSYCGYSWFRGEPGEQKRLQSEPVVPRFPDGHELLYMLERNSLPGPTLCVRRSCFEVVGIYNESMLRSQDYEMALRLMRRFPSVSLGAASYYRRLHGGERGPRLARHSADETEENWLAYDQVVFRRLRREMELREFLPRNEELNTQRQRRRALLHRGKVMAFKGLSDEMGDDLCEALSLLPDPLDDAEALAISTLLAHPEGRRSFLGEPRVWTLMERGMGARNRSLRAALLRGLYWATRRAAARRDLTRLRSALGAALRVLSQPLASTA